MNNYCV